MPKYIGYTPTFTPISLNEYLQVPQAIINEYKEAEKTFNDYQDKKAAIAALAGDNEKAKAIMQNYDDQTQAVAEAIANGGIQDASQYRQAKQARQYYREYVMPLEPAITNYQTAQQVRAKRDDGTIIGPDLSLDTYIDNPLYQDAFINGSNIQAEAMKAAMASSVRRKQQKIDEQVRNGQYWKDTDITGYAPEEVKAWFSGNHELPELDEIVSQISNKYGTYDQDKVKEFIVRGIYDGIQYDQKSSYAPNQATMASLQARYAPRQSSSNSGNDNYNVGNNVLTPRVSKGTITSQQKKLSDSIKKLEELNAQVKANPKLLDPSYHDYQDAKIPKAMGISAKTYDAAEAFRKEYVNAAKEVGDNLAAAGISGKEVQWTHQTHKNKNGQSYKSYYINTNLVKDAFEFRGGYNLTIKGPGWKDIMDNIPYNAGFNGEFGGDNDHIKEYDSKHGTLKAVKNKKLREIDWDKCRVYIEDNQWRTEYNGHTYVIPLNILDEETASAPIQLANGKTMTTVQALKFLWESHDYVQYNALINKVANDLTSKTRTYFQTTGGTSVHDQNLD